MNALKSTFIWIFLLWSVLGITQEKSIVIESGVDTLLFGNILEITITLYNIETSLNPLYLEDFTVLSSPNISSQYQSINGEVTQSQSYSYLVKANEEGQFTIPSVEINTGEEITRSNELLIVVKPNPEGIITKPERKQNSFFFDWSSPQTKQQPTSPDTPVKPDPLRKKRKKI